MFCDIYHDIETVLSHMSLDVTVVAHRCVKYFNTLILQHVECEIMGNVLKVGIIVKDFFCANENVLSRESLSEDLFLGDIKVEISILFEHGI